MPTLLALLALTLLTARRRKVPARIKYRGRIRRWWFKEPGNRNRVGHGSQGVPYAIANSLAGLWFMARVLGKRWADRDCRKTADGVPVVVHWVRAYEGWRGEGVTKGVEHNTWGVVRTWEAMDKYRIHTIWQDIDYVANRRLQIGLYLEPKAPHDFTIEDWREIKRYADKRGVKLRGYALRANAAQVPLMNAAGIPSKTLPK